MKTKNETNFDFKIFEKKPVDNNDVERWDTTLINTFTSQFVVVVTYAIITSALLKLTAIDLVVLTAMLSKVIITVNAITQTIKYSRKKRIINQLINGSMNIAMLLYMFKYDGFQLMVNMTNEVLSIFI